MTQRTSLIRAVALAILLILCTLAAGCSAPPSYGSIYGYVYQHADARGIESLAVASGEVMASDYIPVSGATVAVYSGPTSKSVISDASGYFILPNLIPGTYAIRIQHSGFTGIELTNLLVVSGQTTSAGAYPLGSLHMLVVGVKDYADVRIDSLNYTENDAHLIADRLWTKNHFAGQFDMLLSAQATKASIESAIQTIGSRMHYQDTFIMFFAGHGALSNATGTAYICPYDSNLNFLSSFISDSELKYWIDTYIPYANSHRSIFVFDSCNSGGMFQGSSVPNFVVIGKGIDVMARNLTGAGHIVITACDEDELAYEGQWQGPNVPGQGLFTWVFADGMRTMAADANDDGWVTVQEAYDHASTHVPLIQPLQTPQMYIGNHYGGPIYAPRAQPK